LKKKLKLVPNRKFIKKPVVVKFPVLERFFYEKIKFEIIIYFFLIAIIQSKQTTNKQKMEAKSEEIAEYPIVKKQRIDDDDEDDDDDSILDITLDIKKANEPEAPLTLVVPESVCLKFENNITYTFAFNQEGNLNQSEQKIISCFNVFDVDHTEDEVGWEKSRALATVFELLISAQVLDAAGISKLFTVVKEFDGSITMDDLLNVRRYRSKWEYYSWPLHERFGKKSPLEAYQEKTKTSTLPLRLYMVYTQDPHQPLNEKKLDECRAEIEYLKKTIVDLKAHHDEYRRCMQKKEFEMMANWYTDKIEARNRFEALRRSQQMAGGGEKREHRSKFISKK
jgi:hypothetical protein